MTERGVIDIQRDGWGAFVVVIWNRDGPHIISRQFNSQTEAEAEADKIRNEKAEKKCNNEEPRRNVTCGEIFSKRAFDK